MSLESILEKIGREAEAERERILGDARRRADKIKAEAEREARKEAEVLKKKAAQEAELEAHRLITQARLEQKLHILDLKKQLVDEVLEKAFTRQEAGMLTMKKRIVLKDGEREESLDRERLVQELRPGLENTIADLLKL